MSREPVAVPLPPPATKPGAGLGRVRAELLASRDAIRIFAFSRALVWALAVLLVLLLRPTAPDDSLWIDPWLHDLGELIDIWGRWDGSWYIRIADEGYATEPSAPAFHPLYPLLVAGLGRVLGGHFLLAGVMLSLAAGALAFVLIDRLARPWLGQLTARRALLYLALFPASLFLQAVYAESLYLLLAVAAFLLAERGRFLGASTAAGLALLARPAAVALILPLALIAWRAGRGRAVAAVLAAPALFALYPIALAIQVGDPLASFRAQHAWERSLSPLGPLGGIVDGIAAPVRDLAAGALTDAALNAEALAYLVVLAALALVAWRRLGAPYGLFAALSIALPLSFPAERWPLMSLPRFGLVVFPLFLALACVASTPRRHRAVLAASAALLSVSVARWTLYHWVA